MPKYIVNMNYVEAKSTNFVIEADSEDEIYDIVGELDYTFFEKNCRWLISDFEPPTIDNITMVEGKLPNKPICTKEQNIKIQKKFDKVITQLNKTEDQ